MSFIGLLMLEFSVQEWNHGKHNRETRCNHMLNEITEVNLYEICEPPCDVLFCECDLYECCMHLMCRIRSCMCVLKVNFMCVSLDTFIRYEKMLCYR